ncbi:D-arabinono-1,4-lactone oxidase [Desulfonatronum parangueonense]
MKEWSNWSGSLRFTPAALVVPENEEELAQIVRRAGEEGKTVRVSGAGHSSTPLVQTTDILVSMKKITGFVSKDGATIAIRGGTMLKDANEIFLEHGLALENLGDVDLQALAGAIGTGTHGTGRNLRIISNHLVGGRLVNGKGEIVDFNIKDDHDFTLAARVALGTLGIFTELRLRLLPAFHLHRKEWCTHIEDCMVNLDKLIASNRNFDFYWYPRSDEAKLRTLNIPGTGPEDIPYAWCQKERVGWSGDVIPRTRENKFDEIEFWLPIDNGPPCFEEIRQRIKEVHRKDVGWRVLYRTVAADEALLSGAHGRATATISMHHNASLPHDAFFRDIEPYLIKYGGRPHWGKKHYRTAAELKKLYPRWDRFQEIRKSMDPEGVFMNEYLRTIFEEG